MILSLIETGGPGGAEQMLLRLADEYKRRGLKQIICLRKEGWLSNEVRKRGMPLMVVPLGKLPDAGWLWELTKLAREQGIVAIHAHEFAMNARAAILGWLLGIPVVATVHGKGYFTDKWTRRLTYRVASRKAHIIAVSEDIRKSLIMGCNLSPKRVMAIPNGVDTDRFRFNEVKRCLFRKQFRVGDSTLLLGTIGSYYPIKGHSYLIEAMKRLSATYKNVKLVMAGQGPLADKLKKQIEDLQLSEYVQIAGYIEDTPGFLSALDIFVMPSLSEGLPLALIEAAANERCIVASEVGGIPEIIVNKESGVLVPAGNVEALSDALAGLLTDSTLRFKLAANMAAKVKRCWSIRRTADRYLELLLPRATDRYSLQG